MQLVYFVVPQFGLGFDYSSSFSPGEHTANHTVVDTTIYYNYYSYDYKVTSVTSHDRLYMKQSTIGISGTYRVPWKNKMSLDFGLSIGMADYLQMFQIEYLNVEERTYKNPDTLVDVEVSQPEGQVFGIQYHAMYIRPQVSINYFLNKRFSLKGTWSLPLSYVEKGYSWNDNDGYYGYYSIVFYPESRFLAGNLAFSGGLEISF
jgi:hypothetical protein